MASPNTPPSRPACSRWTWHWGRAAGRAGVSSRCSATMAQRAGGRGAFLDADHGASDASIRRFGIDPGRLFWQQTNDLEEVFTKVEELVTGNEVDVVALDGIAALLPARRL